VLLRVEPVDQLAAAAAAAAATANCEQQPPPPTTITVEQRLTSSDGACRSDDDDDDLSMFDLSPSEPPTTGKVHSSIISGGLPPSPSLTTAAETGTSLLPMKWKLDLKKKKKRKCRLWPSNLL